MCAESKAQNTPLILYIILGYTQTDKILSPSLSLSLSLNLFILSPSLSHLNLLITCMRTARLITLLFQYIILHNDYHNKSWYNV